MSIEFRQQRRIFGGHSRAQLAVCLLASVVAAAFSSAAHASLVCPEPAAFELGDLSAAADAGTSSTPAEEPFKHGDKLERDWHSPAGALSGGTTSGTTSSGSGTSGSAAPAIGTIAGTIFCNAEFVRRVAGEQRLTLPMAPGKNLLRPPQAV